MIAGALTVVVAAEAGVLTTVAGAALVVVRLIVVEVGAAEGDALVAVGVAPTRSAVGVGSAFFGAMAPRRIRPPTTPPTIQGHRLRFLGWAD